MSTIPTRELYERYVMPTYGRFELNLVRGLGSEVWDENGKRYLDFGAGIAVTSVGHCHPRVIAKMQQQIAALVHVSNLYFTRPQGELAERLVRITGPGKIFFCNSGAEANEALYKLARKFGNQTPAHTPRAGIITMRGSFHGRTLGGIAATGQDKVKKGFEPMIPGFALAPTQDGYVPFNDCETLRAAVAQPGVVAVMLEPVQGESGIHPATPEFLRLARQLCDQHGLLLFFDEVQCGLGRTGDWCGWKTIAPDVMPDAVSWAKGIAGGIPLGAMWASDREVTLKDGTTGKLCDLLGPGSHGTTFGGTPLVCAGASEVLAIIEEEAMLENARTTGAHALKTLRAIPSPKIQEVRGIGLMLGIELAPDFPTGSDRAPSLWMVDRLHEAGLLVIPSGTHALRWLPPLNVTREQIDEAAAILTKTLA